MKSRNIQVHFHDQHEMEIATVSMQMVSELLSFLQQDCAIPLVRFLFQEKLLSQTIVAQAISSYTESSTHLLMIAIHNQTIIGSCAIAVEDGIGKIIISVVPEYHGKNVATALLEQVFSIAFENGVSSLHALVPFDNLPAYRFFRKMGFWEDLPIGSMISMIFPITFKLCPHSLDSFFLPHSKRYLLSA